MKILKVMNKKNFVHSFLLLLASALIHSLPPAQEEKFVFVQTLVSKEGLICICKILKELD